MLTILAKNFHDSEAESESGNRRRCTTCSRCPLLALGGFLCLISPWCLFASAQQVKRLPSQSLFLFLLWDCIINSLVCGIFPCTGVWLFNQDECTLDVRGLCSSDVLPASCYPAGILVLLTSLMIADLVR